MTHHNVQLNSRFHTRPANHLSFHEVGLHHAFSILRLLQLLLRDMQCLLCCTHYLSGTTELLTCLLVWEECLINLDDDRLLVGELMVLCRVVRVEMLQNVVDHSPIEGTPLLGLHGPRSTSHKPLFTTTGLQLGHDPAHDLLEPSSLVVGRHHECTNALNLNNCTLNLGLPRCSITPILECCLQLRCLSLELILRQLTSLLCCGQLGFTITHSRLCCLLDLRSLSSSVVHSCHYGLGLGLLFCNSVAVLGQQLLRPSKNLGHKRMTAISQCSQCSRASLQQQRLLCIRSFAVADSLHHMLHSLLDGVHGSFAGDLGLRGLPRGASGALGGHDESDAREIQRRNAA
mmetsp:Transcript_33115/g.79834  ORF Transcript_33115/g.79834 Transcript_33115/m.79834 type:complete len:345 (+) Transcript_33115:398-1432(+)